MKPEHDQKYIRVHKLALLGVVLILGAGLLGWRLGRSNTPPSQPANNAAQTQAADANATSTMAVKSLVSYVLPDGWKEASCPAVIGAVFVIPAGGGSVDCNANPSAPIKISVDPGSNKDCNQLQNIQNVKKHICISLYINGHKSLKASTEYLPSSSYSQDTTVNAYYIDTGKDVVKLEYTYTSDAQSQTGFDQLATSIKVK